MNEPAITKTTTLGGTITIVLTNIYSADIIRTMILASIGAIVSFLMSLIIKKVVKWWNTRKG